MSAAELGQTFFGQESDTDPIPIVAFISTVKTGFDFDSKMCQRSVHDLTACMGSRSLGERASETRGADGGWGKK